MQISIAATTKHMTLQTAYILNLKISNLIEKGDKQRWLNMESVLKLMLPLTEPDTETLVKKLLSVVSFLTDMKYFIIFNIVI